MPALGEYPNVYNSALAVLSSKGFQVWFDEKADMYCAEKDGWDFMADNPISLLGLVAIFEHARPTAYKEYWWRQATDLEYHKLPRQPRPYVPVTSK